MRFAPQLRRKNAPHTGVNAPHTFWKEDQGELQTTNKKKSALKWSISLGLQVRNPLSKRSSFLNAQFINRLILQLEIPENIEEKDVWQIRELTLRQE
jgi:hypothetical protein